LGLVALIAILLGIGCGSRAAWAASNPSDEGCNQDDVCRDHFVKGKQLYKQQDFTSALKEFQAAYDRRQTPILLANIGRSLQKLGRPKEALDYYQRCQAASQSDLELQERLKTYITETQALLASAPQQVSSDEPAPQPLSAPLTPVNKPVYKKPWFWAVVGVGAALVIGGVVTGVVLGTRPTADPPLDPALVVLRPMF
jgi:hypothetical protein